MTENTINSTESDVVRFHDERTEMIATLNDLCRDGLIGRRVTTGSIAALPIDVQLAIMAKVKMFGDFNSGNNPYGEREFGSFHHDGETIFWKIDYYAPDMNDGSDDPSDMEQTERVLTVMMAWEY